LLTGRPDRPGLIGVRAESKFAGEEGDTSLLFFWVDPAKDYLCVREEHYHRSGRPWKDKPDWQPTEPLVVIDRQVGEIKGFDHVREITEFAQTPEGRWYPKVILDRFQQVTDGKRCRFSSDGHRYEILLDTAGPIPEALFAWPPGVAEPQ
jgi:hypothetical protein